MIRLCSSRRRVRTTRSRSVPRPPDPPRDPPPHPQASQAPLRQVNPAHNPLLLRLRPAQILLERLRAELSHDFNFSRALRISAAPGRLDVMGGIADYTGSDVCELPL